MCGEKYHMRGMAADIRGITPAYAGKSCVVSGRASHCWDHPRMCGEKPKKIP